MNRKEIITILVTIAVAGLTVVTAMLPNTIKEQYPWIWEVLVAGAGLLVVVIIGLLLPIKLWQSILGFFPIKMCRELYTQGTRPSRFLYVQKPRFVFLPMSGGVNYQKWSYEFTIVSCLFRDLKVDRIDTEVTYPISEIATLTDDICLTHLSATMIDSRQANISDTSFHYLANQAKLLKVKGYIDVRLKITGFYNGRKKFIIEDKDVYMAELNEWGQNNPKENSSSGKSG